MNTTYQWVKAKECPANYEQLHWREAESKCKVTIFPYEHFVLVTDADGAHDTYALDWNKIEYLEELPSSPTSEGETADLLERFKRLWYNRNPVHEVNADTGEDMFWETALMVAEEYAKQSTPLQTEGKTENGWVALFKDESEWIEYLKWQKDKQGLPVSVQSGFEKAINEVADNQFGERLNAGRHYLMGVQPNELTVEDALEAFGFNRNGI